MLLTLIYTVLLIVSVVVSIGVIAFILSICGAEDENATKVGCIVTTIVTTLYFLYLVVQENSLGMMFQSS